MQPPEPLWSAELNTCGPESTQELAARIGSSLRAGDLLLLTGELGAGKTTFTQGLGAGLGVREGIISPTFVLSRIHPSLTGGPDLVHVDAYRLSGIDELEDLDLEQGMDRSVTVIEWGAGKAEQLSDSRLEVTLTRESGSTMSGSGEPLQLDFSESEDDEPRTITVAAFGPAWMDRRLF
ncbi:tRNA (adenosine(37)-N6)-threonylcarbamoyltransferase complex ATPase subunit type 1 TsaE [Arthrobacter sp.]|uniref:tRNA (adenosine(37)-N6)-threonylcarbamoyltransferase complex ATPase subunit type 1 TsaE n=1 Tax=Arthrobacter sp. TaxID=1667 RepID=UPI003A8E26D9